MSSHHHFPHWIHQLLHDLPPITEKKNPVLAGLIGFFLGGIGLGIYFQSWKDCVYLVLIFIMLSILLAPFVVLGPFLALLLAAVWGVVRAADSGGQH